MARSNRDAGRISPPAPITSQHAVLSGSAALDVQTADYLSFSGGSFDTIRIRDTFGDSTGGSVTHTLARDNIETQQNQTPVPEPDTMLLFTSGLSAILAVRKRKTKLG